MDDKTQKQAFVEYEADGWFDRNIQYIKTYEPGSDRILALLKEYKFEKGNLLEVGCSAGHRLNGVRTAIPGCAAYGIEPSRKAVEFGREHFPGVSIEAGTADDLSAFGTGSMDIVVVGFVFYVIDRAIVFKVISEVDRVLKNGGLLIIADFFSESPLKNEYSYIKDFKAYSFKQNYEEIFTASRMYYLLDKSTLNHLTRLPDASDDYYNKYSITLLKKDILASYK
jgi:SAM-dependent methyltransferase